MAFKVHWYAPLQPKGFLKIVEFILALIALSLVAGFSIDPSLSFNCYLTGNYSYTFRVGYAFDHLEQTLTATVNGTEQQEAITHPIPDKGIMQSAQFFVAWGALTLMYCIVALLVYMLVTANQELERAFDFLVATDIVFHIVWVLCWFIASVDWAVAFNRLKNYVRDYFEDLEHYDCLGSEFPAMDVEEDTGLYVQAAIAVVFGFLIQFVWAANIGWLVIDTSWYINWRASRGYSSTT